MILWLSLQNNIECWWWWWYVRSTIPNRSFLIYYRAKFTWLFRSYLFTKCIVCREVCIRLMWNVRHLHRSSERSYTNFHFPFLHNAPKMSKRRIGEKITVFFCPDRCSLLWFVCAFFLCFPFSLVCAFYVCRFLTLSFKVGCTASLLFRLSIAFLFDSSRYIEYTSIRKLLQYKNIFSSSFRNLKYWKIHWMNHHSIFLLLLLLNLNQNMGCVGNIIKVVELGGYI